MDLHTKNKFSRQIGAVGKKTMEKLMDISVLIIGGDITSMECIKCLALIGIKKIIVIDNDKLTKKKELNVYYSIKKSIKDSNKDKKNITLAENCVEFAKELNPSLITEIWNTFNLDNIKKSGVNAVIMTKQGKYNRNNIDKFCSKNNIKFIMGLNYELEGYIFSNFGKHCVIDKDGEPCVSGFVENHIVESDKIIMNIEKLDTNILSTKGKLIGNEEININVKDSSLTSITVDYSDKLKTFLENNHTVKFIETKETIYKTYKNFTDKNVDEYTYLSDTTSFPNNNDEINTFLNHLDSTNILSIEFRKKQPFSILSSIIGGILAHEVIKITGKYMPIEQQIYFNYNNLRGKDFYKSANTRNCQFLDRELIRKIKKANVFMVGCGALGCEISKNLGMIEMCSNVNSRLSITDMDIIENSNLNRQFLFRNDNIGDSKSETVKTRINEYCPKTNISSHNSEVSKNTEDTFNSAFWKSNDIIIGALDNVEARKYVDSKCNDFDIPLFDSGTLGTKCNTQTIIPHKTATYSELSDQVEKSIPMCTIKTFPNKIEHCIEWAMDMYHTYLTTPIQDLNKLMTNITFLEEDLNTIDNQFSLKQRLKLISQSAKMYSESIKNNSLEAFFEFISYTIENVFINPIKDILYTFPEDLSTESGVPFWSGKKLKPKILKISDINKTFAESIHSQISQSFPMPQWSDEAYDKFISDYKSTDYICKKLKVNEKKDTIEEKNETDEIIDSKKIKEHIDNCLVTIGKDNCKSINTIQYDKDDDIGLEVMTNISNLRAEIYSIDTVDVLDIKLISGKIIPALSTTTTVISGFVIIEILKYFNGSTNQNYTPSDINVNLASNHYMLFDSLKPKTTYDNMYNEAYGMKVKAIPYKFTTWDKIIISTTKECCPDIEVLVSILKCDHNININMLTYGSTIVYDINQKTNKSIFQLFNDLNISKCEHIKLSMYAYDNKTGTPILTPPLIIQN